MPCRFSINNFANNNSDRSLSEEEYSTAKALFELSGLTTIDILDENNFESFKAQIESTSNAITDELFKYWTTNENLEIRFEVEHTNGGRFLNIRVYNSKHRVTLPLRNRSKGFVWFFSFLVWFSKLQGKKDDKYILLLDEPGLSLHAAAQNDLLRFIDEVLAPNYQVLYTTHSPFMIDSMKLNEIRTVYDTQDKNIGSIVSDALEEKDATTLFPLQAALGYNIAQNLYISAKNLLVEGISDLIYLNYFSELIKSKGKTGLKDGITIVPVGGADKIATFISLMRGNELDTVCLLDTFTDQSAKARLDKMIVQNIIKNKKIIFYHDILNTQFADVEDMFSPSEYIDLYNGVFAKNISIDEIDTSKGIMAQLKFLNNKKDFNHYSPARYLLQRTGEIDFCEKTLSNFDTLFSVINKLL
jgi:predicted ATP-dependent endonuclease of OLD family